MKIEKVDADKAEELTRKAQQNEIDYYMNEDPKSIRHKEHTVEELIAAREAEEASVYTNE